MLTNVINNSQAPINLSRSEPSVVSPGQRGGTVDTNKVSSGDESFREQLWTGENSIVFGKLQSEKHTRSQQVKGIKIADDVMDKAGGIFNKMKAQLDSIIKNYPPFGLEDDRRIEYLMTFEGLRRQIEQLTIPPDNKTAEQYIVKVRSSDIPELTKLSSDEEIVAAITKLNDEEDTIKAERQALQAEANRVINSDVQAFESLRRKGMWDDLTANSAESLSKDVRSGLSATDATISDSHQGVLQSLG